MPCDGFVGGNNLPPPVSVASCMYPRLANVSPSEHAIPSPLAGVALSPIPYPLLHLVCVPLLVLSMYRPVGLSPCESPRQAQWHGFPSSSSSPCYHFRHVCSRLFPV
jgi:hypothetical protein